MKDALIIGISPGSSQNGVAAVLVNFTRRSMDLLHAQRIPYPVAIRKMLDQMREPNDPPRPDVISLLDETLGRFFARTAQDLVRGVGMEMRDILAIGCHGPDTRQTSDNGDLATLQLGNPPLLAGNTGVRVVSKFRDADIAAGGRGAPLAPLLHKQLFLNRDEHRAVLDIGKITSLTLLPASGAVSGFYCGPGICLMDAWAQRHLQESGDHAGKWAATGKIRKPLLERLLQDPCLDECGAGNTGPERLSLDWLDAHLADSGLTESGLGLADIQATITELTALSVRRCLQKSLVPKRLLVCGTGAQNTYLLGRIAAALPDVVVDKTNRYGADSDWVEGLLFAWLALERLSGREQDTPPITGAANPVLLGDIFEP